MTGQLLIAIVAVCGFMFLQDTLGSGLSVSQARVAARRDAGLPLGKLGVLPGAFDALGDYPSRYGGAVVAVTSVHFGLWSWQLAVVTTACALTSFATTNEMTSRLSRLLPKGNR